MSKKVYYYNEHDLEGLKWIAKVMDFGVSLEVVSAFNEIRVSYIYLRERKDLFRHTIKQNCNNAMKALKIRETEIKSLMINKKFWDEYSDPIIDLANDDIEKFRKAIKQTLDDANYKDSEIISYVETARVLMDMSIKQWDTIIDEARRKYGRDYSQDFSEYRVTNVYNWWSIVCDELYKGVSIDLNNETIDSVFNEMCEKFAEGKYVEDCLKEAQKTNPDFINAIVVKEE